MELAQRDEYELDKAVALDVEQELAYPPFYLYKLVNYNLYIMILLLFGVFIRNLPRRVVPRVQDRAVELDVVLDMAVERHMAQLLVDLPIN